MLSAQGTSNEKVAFLTAAVGLATTVDESAIIELAEQLPGLQGVSLTGGTSTNLNRAMLDLISKYEIGKWSPAENPPLGPGMLAVALHKCSGLRNPAYAEVIKARFLAKCEEWKGVWKKEFCDDVVKLISRLISDALKKGVNLSDR